MPKTKSRRGRAGHRSTSTRDWLGRARELHDAGRWAEAEQLYRRVLTVEPHNPSALHFLAMLSCQVDRPEQALELTERALSVAPHDPAVHNTAGIVRWKAGRRIDAILSWRRAVELDPRCVEALVNLGVAVTAGGDHAEAARLYEQGLAVDPDSSLALNNLATLRLRQGRHADAIALCQRALARQRDAVTLSTLGSALRFEGRLTEALAAFDEACERDPRWPNGFLGLGSVLRLMGQSAEALIACRHALDLGPSYQLATDNLLFTLLSVPGLEPSAFFAEHLRWDLQHGLSLARWRRPHDNDPDPERRLRIGYLSPDFRGHAVAHFVEPLLACHDRERYEVIAYANVARPDDVTARLAGLADTWRDISLMGDGEVAELVRADGIDVLVDLACHTAGNRLAVFARKPAPVQVTHNVTTSGLSAIDYLVADTHLALDVDPGLMAETLIRLPRCFTCYAPPTDAPAPAPPPVVATGYVTFGSFNNLAKLNDRVVALWAAVLRAVPGSRLVLKSSFTVDPPTHERLLAAFAAHDVGGRVECLDRTADLAQHFAQYARVDVALDPFPFNGHTTTCEALWMGVPVVTLAGRLFVDRVGVSLLTAVGLPELVAATPEDYVRLAVELATDVPRLETLRGALRTGVASSSLCDARGYTRELEAAYRDVWRRWCRESTSAEPHADRLAEHTAAAS